jgi:hypothetical protein
MRSETTNDLIANERGDSPKVFAAKQAIDIVITRVIASLCKHLRHHDEQPFCLLTIARGQPARSYPAHAQGVSRIRTFDGCGSAVYIVETIALIFCGTERVVTCGQQSSFMVDH